MKDEYETLNQIDCIDDEYIYKVSNKYSSLIGQFLIDFSYLEYELNVAIAEVVHSDFHETGYVIIEKLTFKNKIELFYKLYVRYESFNDKKNKAVLDLIRQQLKLINDFRNNVVHANWQTLSKDGFVRTKIVVDNEEGYVKFKKVLLTPEIIRKKTKEIEQLINKMYKYCETALQI